MKPRFFTRLLSLTLLMTALLAACGTEGESLPLSDHINPEGFYTMQIPQDWQTDYNAESRVLKLSPPDAKGEAGELEVYVLTVPVYDSEPDARLERIKAVFEPFIAAHVDDDQKIINRGETTVNRQNAVLLDFGKPLGESYLTGREVLVNSATHAIAFLGIGEDKAWQAFLPTFRKMLQTYQLQFNEPTPLPGGYRP